MTEIYHRLSKVSSTALANIKHTIPNIRVVIKTALEYNITIYFVKILGMLKKNLLAVFLVILVVPRVYAAEEFATSYDVTYEVGTDGVTQVTEKISLRNKTEEYYANQFKLIIGATQVFDIKAQDEGGSLEVTSNQKDTSTEISVKFNQQVVGLNKVFPWTLQFKSKDFAQNIGKVWEVTAPRVSSSSNLDSYKLTLSVPIQFGEPESISPTPNDITVSAGKRLLTFDYGQLKESGVSASFGTHQLFDFDLTYHLENNNLVPVLTNIALPPDTAYQDVIYQKIDPQPLNTTIDDDGNYLAWYRLNRGQKMDIKVKGSSKLYSQSKVKNPFLDQALKIKYTKADKYWEKDHPQIQKKVSEILKEAKKSEDKVKLIYQYVVNALKYDTSRIDGNIERFGAVTALNNPDSAVCMEFTDSFVALARASGIPARELDGFAYTVNPKLRPLSLRGDSSGMKDILHAWPEYWDDKKGWVMVDPTWENTTGGVDYFHKLDLNHFVFVTKGASSEQPVPAGNVKVNLAKADFLPLTDLDVSIENAEPILAGFPGKIKVRVTNLGNTVYPANNFLVTTSNLTILDGDKQNLGPVPAFGHADFELNIRTEGLFDAFNDQIIVLIGSQKFSKDVQVEPFLLFQTFPLISIGIVSLMGMIYLVILGGRIYAARLHRKR